MYQTDPPPPPKEVLPTMYNLPSEDPEEPGLPDEFHDFQPQLLRETFQPSDYLLEEIFIGTDLNLYYDARNHLWYKRPDWFAVLGASRLYQERDLRLSYVVWQEGIDPTVVVELLSPGTEKEDLGQTLREVNQPPTKWEVYERILRIPYYIIFDRYTDNLQLFQNIAGRYQEITFTKTPVWLPSIELSIGLWQGTFQGIERLWLRWYDAQGNLIPTPAEKSEQQRESTQKQLEQERTKAERLATKLRELGVNPEEV